jgi:hypothetical protein
VLSSSSRAGSPPGPKPIAVGADPGYVRRLDVVLQLSHARPDVPVHATLAATVRCAAPLA